jgi:ABC-2 type transport system ATP-binding protein
MHEYAVTLKGVSKWFGGVKAVDDLSLSVRRGEMFGLVGPDGAGKTTVIRMLCNIIVPDSGKIEILGTDIDSGVDDIKTRIGYLSQTFSLYGDLTVDENIEFFAEIHEIAGYRERREELLQFMRLMPYRGRLSDRLSGGMKQKLALACTLIHTPEIIFLDQPTVGVDPVSRRDFWIILSQLKQRGITIITATPYLDEAERCTRVALVSKGRLMVCDTPSGIRRLMKGTVIEIVCTKIRRALSILKDSSGISEVQAFGDRLNIVMAGDSPDLESVSAILSAEGIEVEATRIITPSLENVFISMIGAG